MGETQRVNTLLCLFTTKEHKQAARPQGRECCKSVWKPRTCHPAVSQRPAWKSGQHDNSANLHPGRLIPPDAENTSADGQWTHLLFPHPQGPSKRRVRLMGGVRALCAIPSHVLSGDFTSTGASPMCPPPKDPQWSCNPPLCPPPPGPHSNCRKASRGSQDKIPNPPHPSTSPSILSVPAHCLQSGEFP